MRLLTNSTCVVGEPPDLDFDDLTNNFDKRTDNFTWYQEQLLPQNPRLLHWIGSLEGASEASVQFIIRTYHHKPYIYEMLPEELSTRIAEKVHLLAQHENSSVRELIKHIQFSLKLLNGK